jgi:hypothetical protein
LARGSTGSFDYGGDFEIYCHLSFHAARQGKNAVAGQVGEIPQKKKFGFFQLIFFIKLYFWTALDV